MNRDELKKEYDGYFGTDKNYKNTMFYQQTTEEQKKLFDMIMQEFKNNPALTGRDVMKVTNNVRDYLECQLEVVKESLIIS
mgnify:FL=1